MLGCQSRTKTLAYRSPILLPHQLQYFLSKFHFMSMVRGPTHTAMLQPCGALLPISPPQSLRLPVAHLQELAGIYDPQMLAPHTRQHFHPSQLLLAHLCPPQSDLLSEVLLGDITIVAQQLADVDRRILILTRRDPSHRQSTRWQAELRLSLRRRNRTSNPASAHRLGHFVIGLNIGQ